MPKDLATGAEVILVSGYKSFMTRVSVDRPGKSVLLILASHEGGRWQVSASRETTLRAILVSTMDRSTVDGPLGVPAYAAPSSLCCATKVESAEFRSVITALASDLGVNRIAAFRGQYDLPGAITISELDAATPELTLAGTPVTKPDKKFEFELITTDLRPVRWTNLGPTTAADAGASIIDGKTLVLRSGVYVLRPHEGLYLVAKPGDTPRLLPLPPGYPAFSWATDLAYDSKRGIVSVVSLGGEGFFYRYDVAKGAWLDYRSMNNIDVTALGYDSTTERYIGWSDDGTVLSLSPEGVVLDRKNVRNRLPGWLATVGSSGPPAHRMRVVPKDGYVALVLIDDPRVTVGRPPTVFRVWTYDARRDVGWLTYKR